MAELLSGFRAQGPAGALALAGEKLPEVATSELLGVLSALQRTGEAAPAQRVVASVSPSQVRDLLAAQLRLQQDGRVHRALGKTDEDTLDLVSLLFDFILADPMLPDALKALISRLQIPMIKVAIVDKSFFGDAKHPARCLLNNMAKAALGWTDDGDRSEQGLYGRMERIVGRIVDEFTNDISLFLALDEELAEFLRRESRGAELAEERATQVSRGKEQLRIAKDRVQEEINRRLEDNPRLPGVVRQLLGEGWRDVLLLTYLRQGADSENWRHQLAVADQLVWSVGPKRLHGDRQELLRAIPELLRGLKDGLGGISFDQHQTARLFKELQACHINCLRGSPAITGPAPAPPPGAEVSQESKVPAAPVQPARRTAVPANQAPAAEELDEFDHQAEALTPGTWLEVKEENNQRSRIKLCWKSQITDSYVFVNRKGIKVLEITRNGVARLLRRGAAIHLKDINTPILDRALSVMVRTLKQSDPHGSAEAANG